MYRRKLLLTLAAILVQSAFTGPLGAEMRNAPHPFMLWRAEDLAAVKRQIEATPAMAQSLERLKDSRHHGLNSLYNLLQYRLYGDTEAADREIKRLMRVVNSPVPRGGAQWINVLRYDLLHDRLSADQKDAFEKMARVYIDHAIFKRSLFDPDVFNDERNFSRYDAKVYTPYNWLPNITWPRKVSANLLALAIKDEKLIRRTWGFYGSWKWYFDEYLTDIGFYSEEFSKMGATPGAMLVYCIAAENLGLNELGFGYTGRNGATMRGHVRSLIHLAYPKVDLGSQRPRWPMLTMGDLRSGGSSQGKDFPSPAFQHALVVGYLPEGQGGNVRWRAHGAWGGEIRGNHPQWDGYGNFVPKMQIPHWFELAHKRWPRDGYGWFLYRMRQPNQETYVPSLLFGLGPIGPDDVQAPPAPSAVWPQRGIAMLRAVESAAYWTTDRPAVGIRLASPYAHNTRDSFTIAGLFAFHRPMLINRQVTPGYARDWSRSVQSHCGLMVDGTEPGFTYDQRIEHSFDGDVRFLRVSSDAIFDGIGFSRAWLLTESYLLDVSELLDEQSHTARWFAHAIGVAKPRESGSWTPAELPKDLEPLAESRKLEAGQAGLHLPVLQAFALDDPAKQKLPKAWYKPQVGVSIRMLGADGLTVWQGRTPLPVTRFRDDQGRRVTREVSSEVGGVSLVAAQSGRQMRFAALYEPFRGGLGGMKIDGFQRLAANDQALGVTIVSKAAGFQDWVLLRCNGQTDAPVSLSGRGASFRFVGFAHVRREGQTVTVHAGRLDAMRLPVGDGPVRFVLNGYEAPAKLVDGVLIWPEY